MGETWDVYYRNNPERFVAKDINLSNLSEYADDNAAADGGIEVGQMYRTGSVLKVRVAATAGSPGTAPTVLSVTLSKNNPRVNDVLTAIAVVTGNPTPTVVYQWKKDGVDIAGAVSNAYNVTLADVGATISCRVTAINEIDTATLVSDATNAVAAPTSAPTITSVALSNTSPTVGAKITANVVADGNPTPTLTYSWKSGGTTVGSNASSYTVQSSDVGKAITCTVTAANGVTPNASKTSAATDVVAAPLTQPTVGGVTLDKTSPVVGDTITVSASVTGNPTPTKSYQWKSGGTNVGTNAATYTVVAGDVGKTITCTVTASNSQGSASSTSAPTATVPSSAPPSSNVYPTAATTGPLVTPTTTVSGPVVLSTPGMVYQDKIVNGCIKIAANNITVKNCIVYGARGGGYQQGCIWVNPQGITGARVENCRIDGGNQILNGISGDGTYLNNDIYGVENGINFESNIPGLVEGNYIHDFGDSSGTGAGHFDGVQLFGNNRNVTVRRNTIIGNWDHTSCVYVAGTYGPYSDNIVVENNYLKGAGYPLYFESSSGVMAPLRNVVWRQNYVGRGNYGYKYMKPDKEGNTPLDVANYLTASPLPPASAPWVNADGSLGTSTGGGDTTPPVITNQTTFNHPEGQPFSLTLTANESVTWSKIGGNDPTLFTLSGNVLSMTAKSFDAPVDSNTNNIYAVLIQATDAAGNATEAEIVVTITKVSSGGGTPGTPVSIWDGVATQGSEVDDRDIVGLVLATRMKFNVAGQITKIRMQVAPFTVTSVPVAIYTTGGSLVASGTATVSAPGWVEFTLPTPISATAGQQYNIQALYKPYDLTPSTAVTYRAQSAYFASGPRDVGPLAAVNGYFAESATMVFANSTYNNSCYFIDCVFVPSA